MTLSFQLPDADQAEVLRRAACLNPSAEELRMLDECLSAVTPLLNGCVEERHLPLSVLENTPALKSHLSGADVLLCFRLSLGASVSALYQDWKRDHPEKLILLSGLLAERLDALCEVYCDAKEASLAEGAFLTPSFDYDDGLSDGFHPTESLRIMGICASPREHTAARCRSCFISACRFRKE